MCRWYAMFRVHILLLILNYYCVSRIDIANNIISYRVGLFNF